MELRRRKRGALVESTELSAEDFIAGIAGCTRLVIFTGSGLSASSGMSMFSTRNGLYDRARKKFKIQDGIKLFTYSFYKQRRAEVQAFFAQIYSEAQGSQAAPGHHALASLGDMGRIVRHYTLNIDGLAEAVGMSTWHHEKNPTGLTVEMHGNIRQLVCPSCHAVEPLSRTHINTMKSQQAVVCPGCQQDSMRFKIMLYDDDQGDCITPEHVFETLEEDLEVADCVLWVGISFEQSASVEYFRRVRSMLSSMGRLEQVTQAVVNPSDEAYFNIISSMSNVDDLRLLDVRAQADTLLPELVEKMRMDRAEALRTGGANSSPKPPHLLLPQTYGSVSAALQRRLTHAAAASSGGGSAGSGPGGGSVAVSARQRRAGAGAAGTTADYVFHDDSDYEWDEEDPEGALRKSVKDSDSARRSSVRLRGLGAPERSTTPMAGKVGDSPGPRCTSQTMNSTSDLALLVNSGATPAAGERGERPASISPEAQQQLHQQLLEQLQKFHQEGQVKKRLEQRQGRSEPQRQLPRQQGQGQGWPAGLSGQGPASQVQPKQEQPGMLDSTQAVLLQQQLATQQQHTLVQQLQALVQQQAATPALQAPMRVQQQGGPSLAQHLSALLQPQVTQAAQQAPVMPVQLQQLLSQSAGQLQGPVGGQSALSVSQAGVPGLVTTMQLPTAQGTQLLTLGPPQTTTLQLPNGAIYTIPHPQQGQQLVLLGHQTQALLQQQQAPQAHIVSQQLQPPQPLQQVVFIKSEGGGLVMQTTPPLSPVHIPSSAAPMQLPVQSLQQPLQQPEHPHQQQLPLQPSLSGTSGGVAVKCEGTDQPALAATGDVQQAAVPLHSAGTLSTAAVGVQADDGSPAAQQPIEAVSGPLLGPADVKDSIDGSAGGSGVAGASQGGCSKVTDGAATAPVTTTQVHC